MALESFSTRSIPTAEERKLLDFLLDGLFRELNGHDDITCAPHYNAGLDNPEFRNSAGIYSDAIFERFHRYATENLKPEQSLLIAGGCGLNRDWNSKWKKSGFFSDVFAPPVANDSDSAIGTAIDAQLYFTGNPKIEWDVYSTGRAHVLRGRNPPHDREGLGRGKAIPLRRLRFRTLLRAWTLRGRDQGRSRIRARAESHQSGS